MGWKNVKTHYRISHIVQVTPEGICIGSGHLPSLIVIGPDGRLLKRYDDRSNDDLLRYQREIDSDLATLKRQVESPDSFEAAVQVYTYRGGEIVDKLCERPGWPNVTHDGLLMYTNMFSEDRDTAVGWAMTNARARLMNCENGARQLEVELAGVRESIQVAQANLAKLNTDHAALAYAAAPPSLSACASAPNNGSGELSTAIDDEHLRAAMSLDLQHCVGKEGEWRKSIDKLDITHSQLVMLRLVLELKMLRAPGNMPPRCTQPHVCAASCLDLMDSQA